MRPFSTFETVEIDTEASAATRERVALLTAGRATVSLYMKTLYPVE
jgi:hypothetical protein